MHQSAGLGAWGAMAAHNRGNADDTPKAAMVQLHNARLATRRTAECTSARADAYPSPSWIVRYITACLCPYPKTVVGGQPSRGGILRTLLVTGFNHRHMGTCSHPCARVAPSFAFCIPLVIGKSAIPIQGGGVSALSLVGIRGPSPGGASRARCAMIRATVTSKAYQRLVKSVAGCPGAGCPGQAGNWVGSTRSIILTESGVWRRPRQS